MESAAEEVVVEESAGEGSVIEEVEEEEDEESSECRLTRRPLATGRYKKRIHHQRRSMSLVELKSAKYKVFVASVLTNRSQSVLQTFDFVSEPIDSPVGRYSPIKDDDHVWQPPGLAQPTPPISIRSLPYLNENSDIIDGIPPSPSLSSGQSSYHVKRTRSEKIKKKHHLSEPQLFPAQRSKSLTHIECMEEDSNTSSLEKQELDNLTVSSGLSGQRHPLAVSMVDISKIDQKHKLQKIYKVSSQEYFTVTFNINDEQVQEYLPAVQGRTLRDALHGLLEVRGIDINSIHIYQESSNTPVLPYCDTGRLAGRHLCVRIRPSPANSVEGRVNGIHENKKLSSRVKKGGSRGLGTPSSSEEPPADGTWKAVKLKGIFFKSDNDKLDALTELLDKYNQNGLPELKGIVTFEDNVNYQLETHWKNIIFDAEVLPERIQRQQNAIWELLQTESNYIRQLKVITNRFQLCLCNLQAEKILNEIAMSQVFSNIHDVAEVNCTFWTTALYPMLEEARRTRQPLNPFLMKDGFMQFQRVFQPYTKYCLDHANCLQYVKDTKRSNELFKAYIAWCETQKECNRQRFADLIFKPMQRLTKYSLLLRAVLKHTDAEDAKHALNAMVDAVEVFVDSVNASLRQRHEQEKFATLQARIDSYDVVEAKDDEALKLLKPHLHLDLTCPMPGCSGDQTRQLLMEGDLKLKDATKNGMDVHCFLFTDMLLICKPLTKKGDRVKVVRQPYCIDRLVLHEMKDRGALLIIYLTEFHVATTMFTLSGSRIRDWHEKIKKAQAMYKEAKSCVKQQPTTLGYWQSEYDEDLDCPSQALLTARSPRSSQSSLVHSHSGSMDMSEPTSGCVSHGRAVSLEFAEMRASSASSDEGSAADPHSRNANLDIRGNQGQPVSPRMERKKGFFSKTNSGSNSPNTLSVSYPYGSDDGTELSPTSLLVPSPKSLSPTSRTITHPPISPLLSKRGQNTSPKPPLMKTKNVSSGVGAGGSGNSPALEIRCFDYDVPVPVPVITTAAINSDSEDDDGNGSGAKSKLNQKRTLRTDRRYHTADSIENMKRDKDPSIHKRFSLNYPPTGASGGGPSGSVDCDKMILRNRSVEKCLSSESMYSSSGVSSTGSLHQSSDYDPLCELLEETCTGISGGGDNNHFDHFGPMVRVDEDSLASGPSSSGAATATPALAVLQPMHVDVSEMKDGISSVQIRVQDVNNGRQTKRDYQKMRDFILNDKLLEASEV